MRTVVLNVALLFALLFTVAANWLVRGDNASPNREFLPQMAHSPRYNAYAANPDFPDGKTLQSPPPGSIAREMMPLHFAATPADAKRAGEELVSPVQPDDQRALARGATVFANFCTPCHGTQGAGNGIVAMRGFPAPPPLLAPHALQMKDGQMFHVLTYGQNNMPSYASQLSRADRWNVISYVRSLQKQNAAATMPAEAKKPGGQP